ncbi:hypothetical protein JJD41_07750 [Oxynema sp. CENA135]|nr:hypothetical protein [Oxynema sp. CENA135]
MLNQRLKCWQNQDCSPPIPARQQEVSRFPRRSKEHGDRAERDRVLTLAKTQKNTRENRLHRDDV